MKTIAIINLKGGVGKTTTAVSLAELLAAGTKDKKDKKRVLLFDNDKQGNASKLFQRHSGYKEAPACRALKYGILEDCIKHTENWYIDIVPCNYYMASAELSLKMDKNSSQHDRYKAALAQVQTDYDYCIIDNAPDLGLNVINALVAADEIIIPVNLDCYALDGLEEVVEQIKNIKALNLKAVLVGCLITDYEKSDTSEAAEYWLREKSGLPIFTQKIRHSKKVKDSTFYKKTPLGYSSRSGAAQDYKKFVAEYLEKAESEGK